MRVAVTGGAGFIGSHLVEDLSRDGHDVLVLDSLCRGRAEHAGGARLLQVDVTSRACFDAIKAFAPTMVVHLAAQMSVTKSVQDPLADASDNVIGTINVAHAAQLAGAAAFIFTSSGGALYGDVRGVAPAEGAALAPMSPYGVSKMAAEGYMDYLNRTSALRCVSLRLANVYGPRQSCAGEGGVISIFASKMLAGTPPRIYGDGLQSRDFVYVTDVTQAIMLAMQTPTARGIFNIGSQTETNLLDLASHLGSLLQVRPELHFEPPRAEEVRRSVLDASRAGSEMAWRPKVCLARGLQQVIASLRPPTASFSRNTPCASPR